MYSVAVKLNLWIQNRLVVVWYSPRARCCRGRRRRARARRRRRRRRRRTRGSRPPPPTARRPPPPSPATSNLPTRAPLPHYTRFRDVSTTKGCSTLFWRHIGWAPAAGTITLSWQTFIVYRHVFRGLGVCACVLVFPTPDTGVNPCGP